MYKTIIVYNLKMAHELCKRGYKVAYTAINRNNPKYLVYHFENEPGLNSAIEQLKNRTK